MSLWPSGPKPSQASTAVGSRGAKYALKQDFGHSLEGEDDFLPRVGNIAVFMFVVVPKSVQKQSTPIEFVCER